MGRPAERDDRQSGAVVDPFAAAMPLWGDPVAKVAIAGDPTTKARPRFGGGRAYSSDRMRAAQNAIGWSLKAAKVPYVDDSDLAVVIHFETKTMQRRDLDNLVKLVLDGATGIAWRDDEQITKILADVQRGSAHPCTEITIYRVGNPYGITCPICNQRSSPKGRSRGPYRATYCSKKCYELQALAHRLGAER